MTAPEITLYNTAKRAKERFAPIDEANIRVYACGPTVYDFAHIGNGRTAVTFDQLFRILRHAYGAEYVTYVRNITDIEDKIIERAEKSGRGIRDITNETAEIYRRDVAELGCLPPTHEPRATEYIDEMTSLIGKLIEGGHAYEAEGHVLFEVSTMASYGALSRQSTDEMVAGSRVEVAPYKRSPMDFVLWKPSVGNQPGWKSPWGRGRPGWHIECSAMSESLLGETFDIHGGGIDLQFPHHENEVAQSQCAHNGAKMANFWMHGGFLQVENQKMSKSLGNFKTIHELTNQWPGELLRFQLLMTHYRQPLNWTIAAIDEAKAILDRWYRLIGDDVNGSGAVPKPVEVAMYDDLNAPKAIAEMHKLAGAAGRGDDLARQDLVAAGKLLGLFSQTADDWFKWRPQGQSIDAKMVEALIDQRNAARADKDYAEADRMRDELTNLGVTIEDGPDGTSWRVT
jgi:cysteinyl-tRNA synthetase